MKKTSNDVLAFPSGTVTYSTDGYACVSERKVNPVNSGMSLRDYFAAKAMQGYCANPQDEAWGVDPYEVARWAYINADAMLKARETP